MFLSCVQTGEKGLTPLYFFSVVEILHQDDQTLIYVVPALASIQHW
jgi:hypothetical protein